MLEKLGNRNWLNNLIRTILAACILIAIAFTVAAARPPFRPQGPIPAEVGVPVVMEAAWGAPAVYITLTHPAVVAPPDDWNMPHQICVVVAMARGSAPTEVYFQDSPPQIEWDDRPGETILFTGEDVWGEDREGGRLAMTNTLLAPLVSTRLPFRVNWFGQDRVPLNPGQPAGGLMCYQFLLTVEQQNLIRVPFFHRLVFQRARNVNVMTEPTYHFRFKSLREQNDPPGTAVLQEMDLTTYLTRLVLEAPFAVRPLTAEQQDFRATETASGR